MKKAISFTIDACLHVDGCVVECQCECAVNVCVVLLALQKFSESGDLITEETSSKISEHFTMLDLIWEVLLKLNICLWQMKQLLLFFTLDHASIGTGLVIRTHLGTSG